MKKPQRALIQRNREIIKLYTTGTSFEELAKKYKLSRERVRQIWLKEAIRSWKDDLERCYNCTTEDVYWETELNRGPKLTLRYAWPKHQKTPKPYEPPPKPPLPPPKPVWVLKLVTYPEGEFLGVTVIRADDVAEAAARAGKLDIYPGAWVGSIMRDADNIVPGDLLGRFTSKEELTTRGLL